MTLSLDTAASRSGIPLPVAAIRVLRGELPATRTPIYAKHPDGPQQWRVNAKQLNAWRKGVGT